MNIQALLDSAGALYQDNHFVYTSGEHGDCYADLRILKQEENEKILTSLSLELITTCVMQAKTNHLHPLYVVGPQTLGAIIAEKGVAEYNKQQGTALRWRGLTSFSDSHALKQYKWGDGDPLGAPGTMQFLYVDDLMNAGSTWTKCKDIIEAYAQVIGIGTLANRSTLTAADLGVPFFTSLVTFDMTRYSAEDCPFCKAGRPIKRRPGHGHTFEKEHPDYVGGYID